MILEKKKRLFKLFCVEIQSVVHNFPIRYPMTIHIDGLIGLYN